MSSVAAVFDSPHAVQYTSTARSSDGEMRPTSGLVAWMQTLGTTRQVTERPNYTSSAHCMPEKQYRLRGKIRLSRPQARPEFTHL